MSKSWLRATALQLQLLLTLLGCAPREPSPAPTPRCFNEGFRVWLASPELIRERLHSAGLEKISSFFARRDAFAREVHIVSTSEPFGGAIIRASGIEPVTRLKGQWVRRIDGTFVTHVSSERIPLVLCPNFAKGTSLEEDWYRLLIFVDGMVPKGGRSQTPGASRSHRPNYCFSVDPAGVAFGGIEVRGDVLSGAYTTLHGQVHHDCRFLTSRVIGYSEGHVAVAGWHIEQGQPQMDAVEITFFPANEFETARATKSIIIRHSVLKPPMELVDMDPTCQCLLVAKPHANAHHARWYVLDVETGRFTRVGTGRAYGLFLRAEAFKSPNTAPRNAWPDF